VWFVGVGCGVWGVAIPKVWPYSVVSCLSESPCRILVCVRARPRVCVCVCVRARLCVYPSVAAGCGVCVCVCVWGGGSACLLPRHVLQVTHAGPERERGGGGEKGRVKEGERGGGRGVK
jgi:hypothetical protein